MKDFATEWRAFRRTVLSDITDDDAFYARNVFYSGALIAFDLLARAMQNTPNSADLSHLRDELKTFSDEMSSARRRNVH
jgi:hypothetical protein